MTIEIDLATDAFVAGDAAGFSRAVAPLGTDLTLARLVKRVAPIAKGPLARECARLVLDVLAAAVSGEAGLALGRAGRGQNKLIAAAVRHENRVVLSAIRLPEKHRNGWPAIERWYRDLAKNRATLLAWAVDPQRAHDAIELSLVGARGASPSKSEGELLAAVIADPSDPAARGVYADALIQRGDPRGEWIHVEDALARSPEDQALQRRRFELDKMCRAAVLESLFGAKHHIVRRGFVREVTLSVAQLAKHGAEIFATHPLDRVTVLALTEHHLRTLATLAIPARVELVICADPTNGHSAPGEYDFTEPEILAFLATRRSLGLQYLRAAPRRWSTLFAALIHTRSLSLGGCNPMPVLLPLLAEAPPALERLRIINQQSCDRPVTASLEAALTALGARLRSYGDVGWDDPAAYTALFAASRLEELELPWPGEALAAVIARLPGARTLRRLLTHSLKNRATEALVVGLPELEALELSNTIDAPLAAVLRASKLRRVTLYGDPWPLT